MGYQPLFIGPLNEGLRKDLQPFLLPNEAFPALENAYEFRGTVYKKGGSEPFGALGVRDETLAIRGAGATVINLALTWPPVMVGSIVITDGVTTFTDNGIGGFTIVPAANGVVNAPTNYVAGTIDITFTAANPGAAITAFYYAAIDAHSPVMGLGSLNLPNSIENQLMAFDTRMSYRFLNGINRFQHLATYRTAITQNQIEWTGTDNDFFWMTNYGNAFWATNNKAGGHFYAITGITNAANAVITIGAHNFQVNDQVIITNVAGMTQINGLVGTVTAIAALTITVNINSGAFGGYTGGGVAHSIYLSKAASGDGIRWFDNGVTIGWVNFSPPLDPGNTPEILQGALIILPYQGRLVCLNTVEGTTYANGIRYPQRARWSEVGNPFQGAIVPSTWAASATTDQWYETTNHGGYLDAPTNEEIVSAAFIKDTLVVFFEKSCWALITSGNPVSPFSWIRINSERGSESTFSTIGFDNEILTIGENAVVACDPTGAERADLKIPDEIISFYNENEAYKRVNGIRDFFNEFVLWTYVSDHTIPAGAVAFPDSVLAFNYRDGTWSKFRDFYTTFGTYLRQNGLVWGAAVNPWASYNIPWVGPAALKGAPTILGGNAQGGVLIVDDIARNGVNVNTASFSIQNVTAAAPSVITCMNHSFSDGDHVYITNVNGAVALNNNTYTIATAAANTFTLLSSAGVPVSVAGYTYGGNVTVIDEFNITTKNFNPTIQFGKKTRVGYIDLFLFNTSADGEITLTVYVDDDLTNPASVTKISTHDARNPDKEKFWYRAYINQVGQFFTLKLSFSDDFGILAPGQIFNHDLIDESYALYAMILWTADSGRLV